MLRFIQIIHDTQCMITTGGMLKKVREMKPLVCQITNNVTINDCANVTLCTGGSPVMSDSMADAIEMVGMASALVLNIGTVNDDTLGIMISAGKIANECKIPVILDPVGVGATGYRSRAAEGILKEVKVDVIKGNAGEIASLLGHKGKVRGVDSDTSSEVSDCMRLARKLGIVVGMSGEIDYVSDGKTTYALHNGKDMMDMVSGTGCMLSSVIGCFVGANGVSAESVAAAISSFTVAGELANDSKGPASYKINLMDSLFSLVPEYLNSRLKVEEI